MCIQLRIYVTIHEFRVHFESLTIAFRNRIGKLEKGKGLIRKETSIQTMMITAGGVFFLIFFFMFFISNFFEQASINQGTSVQVYFLLQQ